MLDGLLTVLRTNDTQLAESLRRRDDEIDRLYSAIKRYLAQISREALDAGESRRWTEVIQFTINMEHVGDIIERGLLDVAERKIRHGLSFSEAGIAGDHRPARAAGRQPAVGRGGVPQRRSEVGAVADVGEGCVPRTRDALRGPAPVAAFRQHAPVDRDQFAAPGPAGGLQAHQFAVLLRGLPDPRVGRCAFEDARAGRASQRCSTPTNRVRPNGADSRRHRAPVCRQGRSDVHRRARHSAAARTAVG